LVGDESEIEEGRSHWMGLSDHLQREPILIDSASNLAPVVSKPLSEKEAAFEISEAVKEMLKDVSEWRRRYAGLGHVTFDLRSRTNALARLTPQLNKRQLVVALQEVEKVGEEQLVAGALAVLAPHLPADLVEQALDISARILSPENRSEALKAILPRLAKLGQAERALQLGMQFRSVFSDLFYQSLVEKLAPNLPSNLITKALELVLTTPFGCGRKAAMGALDARSTELLSDSLEGAWMTIVTDSAKRGRRELLADLIALSHTVSHAGPELPGEICRAIGDLERWWP
jgi:hypothetical protein